MVRSCCAVYDACQPIHTACHQFAACSKATVATTAAADTHIQHAWDGSALLALQWLSKHACGSTAVRKGINRESCTWPQHCSAMLLHGFVCMGSILLHTAWFNTLCLAILARGW